MNSSQRDQPAIELFTIGFTQKSAERFFGLLTQHQITVLVDIRLKPDSQLSSFAKGRDLPFFLGRLLGCEYQHMPLMAPTAEILERYRADHSWERYERDFTHLLVERDLMAHLDQNWWGAHRACLLCSEHEPDHCHRRLVAEYMAQHWAAVRIRHLI